MAEVSMRDLLKAGAHFGHSDAFLESKNEQIYFWRAQQDPYHQLEHTVPAMNKALITPRAALKRKTKSCSLVPKRAASKIMKEEAVCGMPFVNHRWLGGMLTNYKTIRQSIKGSGKQSQDGTFEVDQKSA